MDNILNKPFPRSYWVEPAKFLAGSYPGDIKEKNANKKIEALLEIGIKTFINLTDENETNYHGNYFVPYNYIITDISRGKSIETSYLKIPIIDQNITNISTMKIILDVIDNSIAKNNPVYIHCWGGIGRTGTVVGCWLIRHAKVNTKNVFEKISELRFNQADPEAYRDAPETDIQREFVRGWSPNY